MGLLGFPDFGITPADDGFYSADTLLIINHESTEDNIYRFTSIDPTQISVEKGSKTPSGGCCSILAVAHSLVRKMGGIVTTESAVDGSNWDPCFLWQVWAATGDGDYPNGGRGLTDGQAETGHEADWNDAWSVRQIDDDSPLFDEGDELTCAQLKERCEKLEGRVENTNDDVTMRIRGKEGKKGDEWGHRVPVESVTYTAGPPCTCEITITRTSVQDPGNNIFEGIPFDPGTATYTITAGSGTATTVSNTEFATSKITFLAFDSFDEEPKNGSVSPTDQGNKGTAFDVVCPTKPPSSAPSPNPSTPPTSNPTVAPTPNPSPPPTGSPAESPISAPVDDSPTDSPAVSPSTPPVDDSPTDSPAPTAISTNGFPTGFPLPSAEFPVYYEA